MTAVAVGALGGYLNYYLTEQDITKRPLSWGAFSREKNTVDHQVETFVIGETRQTLHTTCRFKNVVLTWWKRLMQSWDVEAKALFSVMFCYYNNKADFFYHYYYQT